MLGTARQSFCQQHIDIWAGHRGWLSPPPPPGAYLNHNPSNACNKPKQIDTLDAWGNQQREQSEIAAYGDSWESLSKAIHRLVDSYSNGNFPGKTKK